MNLCISSRCRINEIINKHQIDILYIYFTESIRGTWSWPVIEFDTSKGSPPKVKFIYIESGISIEDFLIGYFSAISDQNKEILIYSESEDIDKICSAQDINVKPLYNQTTKEEEDCQSSVPEDCSNQSECECQKPKQTSDFMQMMKSPEGMEFIASMLQELAGK